MEKKELPKEVAEQIENDSVERFPVTLTHGNHVRPILMQRSAYVAGATAYATKLIEAEETHKQLIKTLLEIEEGKRKEAEERIKELERWKAEAICLLSKIDDYADKHPEIKLGMSKVDFTIDRAMSFDKVQKQATGWRPLLEDILKDNNNGYIDIDEALCSRIKTFLYGE